jgi:hypothetical protein
VTSKRAVLAPNGIPPRFEADAHFAARPALPVGQRIEARYRRRKFSVLSHCGMVEKNEAICALARRPFASDFGIGRACSISREQQSIDAKEFQAELGASSLHVTVESRQRERASLRELNISGVIDR